MKKNLEKIFSLKSNSLAVFVGINVLFFTFVFTLFAYAQWANPTSAPPGSNASTPINTSGFGQSKFGGLILNTGSAVNGLIVANGNVGIGTTTPAEKFTVTSNTGAATPVIGNILLNDISASNDPGDIIFQDSTGTQLARIWSGSSQSLNLSSGDTTPDLNIDTAGNVSVPAVLNAGAISTFDTVATTGTVEATRFCLGDEDTGTANCTENWADAVAIGAPGTINQTLRHDGTNWVATSNLSNDGTNVGIGTVNPLNKIHIEGGGIRTANTAGSWFEAQITDDSNSGIFRVRDSNYNVVGQMVAYGLDGLGAGYIEFRSSDWWHFRSNVEMEEGVRFHCTSCGDNSVFRPASGADWGTLTIQGRVISASSNLHLSPPGGSDIIIDDNYRAAGGGSGAVSVLVRNGGICLDSDGNCGTSPGNARVGSIDKNDSVENLIISSSGSTPSGAPGGFIDLRPRDTSHGLILRDADGSSTSWMGIRQINADRAEFAVGGGYGSGLVLKSNNRVGIGVLSPAVKLDVNGRGRFRAINHQIELFDTSSGSGINKEWTLTTMNNENFALYAWDGGTNKGWKFQVHETGDTHTARNAYANAFFYSSDASLKTEIKPIENALDKVLSLNGVSYKWKESDKLDIGVIAQDVEKVFPEAVNADEETGLKSVNYGHLVGPLIEAVKEQQAQIEDLESRLEALEAKIE